MTHLFRVLIFGCCLLATCANSAQVFEAIERGDTANVEALLAKGVDVNAKDKIGWTPLHRAAYGGKKDLVELLLAKGAEVNAKGGDVNDKVGNGGIAPLHLAVLIKRKDVVELLLAKGAEVNAKDGFYHGMTPLQMAAVWGGERHCRVVTRQGCGGECQECV